MDRREAAEVRTSSSPLATRHTTNQGQRLATDNPALFLRLATGDCIGGSCCRGLPARGYTTGTFCRCAVWRVPARREAGNSTTHSAPYLHTICHHAPCRHDKESFRRMSQCTPTPRGTSLPMPASLSSPSFRCSLVQPRTHDLPPDRQQDPESYPQLNRNKLQYPKNLRVHCITRPFAVLLLTHSRSPTNTLPHTAAEVKPYSTRKRGLLAVYPALKRDRHRVDHIVMQPLVGAWECVTL